VGLGGVVPWAWGYRPVVHSTIRHRLSLMGWSGISDLGCNAPRQQILLEHKSKADWRRLW